MVESSKQPMISAAQRRRQRRLRSWWRHEQQSIAAALATSHHHSALRRQKKVRAGEGRFRVELCGEDQRRHPPPQASGTVYYPMDVDDVLAARGSRPDRLLDVSGPKERVQRRIMEQIVNCVPVVPLLDAPVPQTVDQVVEVLRPLDTVVPEGGDRSAQYHSPRCHPAARSSPCAADGRTAGGRARTLLQRLRAG